MHKNICKSISSLEQFHYLRRFTHLHFVYIVGRERCFASPERHYLDQKMNKATTLWITLRISMIIWYFIWHPGCVHHFHANTYISTDLVWMCESSWIYRENIVSLFRAQADPIARNFNTKKTVSERWNKRFPECIQISQFPYTYNTCVLVICIITAIFLHW